MPNGYYIHNPIEDIFSFKVNEDTEYNFIDWGMILLELIKIDFTVPKTSKNSFAI